MRHGEGLWGSEVPFLITSFLRNQCAKILVVQGVAASGGSVDMEACFSQLTLDVIGKALFNYDFDSLNASSPLIQVCLLRPIQNILGGEVSPCVNTASKRMSS